MISTILFASSFATGSASALSMGLLDFGMKGDASGASCAWVEISNKGKDGDIVEHVAPGHCMRMGNLIDGTPRSRYFNCYAGCGGTKLQYKEYASEDCTGSMLMDTMLHKGKMDPLTTVEGSITGFDCSLAYCNIAETEIVEGERWTKYLPADRQQCRKTEGGYQWAECVDKRHLKVHFGSECHTSTESRELDYVDEDSTKFHGITREWNCNGFDNPEDSAGESMAMMEHMAMLHNIQAERRKAALSLREARAAAAKHAEWEQREVGKGAIPMLVFAGAVLAAGYCVYIKHREPTKASSLPTNTNKYQPISTEEETVSI